jgi:hypothetical protein
LFLCIKLEQESLLLCYHLHDKFHASPVVSNASLDLIIDSTSFFTILLFLPKSFIMLGCSIINLAVAV